MALPKLICAGVVWLSAKETTNVLFVPQNSMKDLKYSLSHSLRMPVLFKSHSFLTRIEGILGGRGKHKV